MRRKQAAEYLKSKYGWGSVATLAKLAVTGGGPEMVYAAHMPLYTEQALDAWAQSKLSSPVRNTSDARAVRAAPASPETV